MKMWPVARIAIATYSLLWAAVPFTAGFAAAADGAPGRLTVLAIGDSLTAGYMLRSNESFPAQLQKALEAKGHKVEITNAGVSGDTTAGGRDRLAWALEPRPDAVILELGANDALRGIDPAETRANLDEMLKVLSAKHIPVLLAGMKAPGNWGDDYVAAFDAIYPDLAKKYDVALYPFFLDGVALNPALILSDGLHPSAAGIAEIVKRILPAAEALLEKVSAEASAFKN